MFQMMTMMLTNLYTVQAVSQKLLEASRYYSVSSNSHGNLMR